MGTFTLSPPVKGVTPQIEYNDKEPISHRGDSSGLEQRKAMTSNNGVEVDSSQESVTVRLERELDSFK